MYGSHTTGSDNLRSRDFSIKINKSKNKKVPNNNYNHLIDSRNNIECVKKKHLNVKTNLVYICEINEVHFFSISVYVFY